MEWISVKNRLPEDNIDVLITDGKWVYISWRSYENRYNPETRIADIKVTGWKSEGGCCGHDFTEDYKSTATHWMPLPIPPISEIA